jgi:hypothetical protein
VIQSELWAEEGRLLNDPNNERWITSVLQARNNQAQTIVQGYTSAVKVKETLTPTADTAPVTINSSSLDIMRVTLTLPSGQVKPIEGIAREELDYRYPNWENWTSGEPSLYWFDGSNSQINLVAKPSAAYALTDALKVWEVRKPADMTAGTDTPFDSNTPMVPYHLAIAHWTVAQCWLDDGTPEALAKSRFHRSGALERPGEFEKQILRIREDFDTPVDIPARILWRPQGGRLGRGGVRSKSYPFSF